jgi:hypothetical protein
VRAEWPDAKCPHEALDMWKDAAVAWLAADTTREQQPGGGVWWLAGGTRRALPFGEYGRAIDLLREEIRYRREINPAFRTVAGRGSYVADR